MAIESSYLIPVSANGAYDEHELHPEVARQALAIYGDLSSRGELMSLERLAGYYAVFRERFGPEVLAGYDGESLLELMHGRTNHESLAYWLEFKDDEEFPGGSFGSIAGGSALKFGVYQRRETGAWMTGAGSAQHEISATDAIAIVRTQRNELLAACGAMKQFGQGGTDAAYASLEQTLNRVAPTVSNSAWGRKYVSLLFPYMLDDFHAAAFQRFHVIKLLQLPPDGEGRYCCSGRFVSMAAAMQWPLNHLTAVLFHRSGPPHRYWRVGTRSAPDDAHFFWPMMRDRGLVAVGWPALGDLSRFLGNDGAFKEAVRAELERCYPTTPSATGRAAQQVTHFCQTMQERDCVLAADGARILGVGRITGSYGFDPTQEFPHLRPVEWLSVGEWHLPTTEGLQTTVYEIRKHPANLVSIETRLLDPTAPPARFPPARTGRKETRSWSDGGMIGRIQDVLDRKSQVILYGPPGTGKTYWAEGAAKELCAFRNFGRPYRDLAEEDRARITGGQSPGFIRTCCFHPAYGYEDFIEGYKPVSRGNVLHFELRDGLFKSLCDVAGSDSGNSYFLIIDEINRGDIPRIFGELLTLLESSKRGMRLSLPLSGRLFAVPANVFVIGTMNTADRSIALLDAALRRRFGFIELMPDSSVLGDTVIGGIPLGPWLDAINHLITKHVGRDGRNLQIGHSYFLHDGRPLDDLPKLARVLREDILPLLEEYCYDDWETLDRILGASLVNVPEARFRAELFEPGRQDALVQALLAPVPEVSASPIAVAADTAIRANADESELDSDGRDV